jgi:NAD(P)-dependent dehydrogenase (short-subunit alcohol dehydrogenase family)
MTAERDLTGKVALVTGAARNLGAGIAEMLGARGACVVVHHHDRDSLDAAGEVAEHIRESGGAAIILAADLSDPAEIDTLTAEIVRRFGRYDILINNAGAIVKKAWSELDLLDFERAFSVNARAPFQLMQHAADAMNDGGRVVNIGTSLLGMSLGWYTLYAASKASIEHYARSFAAEFKARGITANTVAPGSLETSFFHDSETEESVALIKQMTGGLGKVADVVPVVSFLVSAEANWISGQTIFVNGGLLTR